MSKKRERKMRESRARLDYAANALSKFSGIYCNQHNDIWYS